MKEPLLHGNGCSKSVWFWKAPWSTFYFLTNKLMTMQRHAPLSSLLMQVLFSRRLSASHCLMPTLTRPSGNRYGRAEISLNIFKTLLAIIQFTQHFVSALWISVDLFFMQRFASWYYVHYYLVFFSFFVIGFRLTKTVLTQCVMSLFLSRSRVLLCSQSCFFKSALAYLEIKYYKPVICNNHVNCYDNAAWFVFTIWHNKCNFFFTITAFTFGHIFFPYFRTASSFTWTIEVKDFLTD